MAKYRNFDAFYQEQKQELLVFTLFDTKYTLPSSMPAKLMLEILRGQKDSELQPGVVIDVCESLLGIEQLNDLTKKGLTLTQMEDIITWSAEEYSHRKKDDNETEDFTEKK